LSHSNIYPTDELIVSTQQSNLNSLQHLHNHRPFKLTWWLWWWFCHFAIIWPVLIVIAKKISQKIAGSEDEEMRENYIFFAIKLLFFQNICFAIKLPLLKEKLKSNFSFSKTLILVLHCNAPRNVGDKNQKSVNKSISNHFLPQNDLDWKRKTQFTLNFYLLSFCPLSTEPKDKSLDVLAVWYIT